MIGKFLSNILTLIMLVFMLTSVVGYLLDRPILLSYVTSESMSPTLEKGDLFVINPFAKGKVGDIIVFKLRDRWTVHRIFAETSGGYITKGDNNIATDQQDNGSPVKKGEVAGVVVTVFGKPLKIPMVGNYIQELSKRSSNVFVAIAVIALGSILMTRDSDSKKKKRKKKAIIIRYKTLYAIVSSIFLAMFVISVVASWGSVGFNYISTKAGNQQEGWYLPNSEFVRKITIKNRALYPTTFVLSPKSDRVTLDRSIFTLQGREERYVNVHVRVPSDTRVYYELIDVYSYPSMLPSDAIGSMWKVSKYLPLIALTSEIGAVLAGVYLLTGSDEDYVRIKIRRRFIW